MYLCGKVAPAQTSSAKESKRALKKDLLTQLGPVPHQRAEPLECQREFWMGALGLEPGAISGGRVEIRTRVYKDSRVEYGTREAPKLPWGGRARVKNRTA